MQMKEICERTGLTDRAVRLYIENGLLSPTIESNYAGRRSIRFSEEDAEILSAIAVLRQAEFSLSDIREMQTEPARIPEIVDGHKRKLSESVEAKLRTLRMLEDIDSAEPLQYTDVAALLSKADAPHSIPKEDSSMSLKDLQILIRRRIPSVIGFAVLLIGVVFLAPLTLKSAFAELLILVGGGYRLDYTFTAEALVRNLPLLILPLLLIGGAVLLLLHILSGRRHLTLAAGVVCAVCLVWMLLLPEELRQSLFQYEFLEYRYSFMWSILPGNSAGIDALVKTLKLLPPFGGLICCALGWITSRKED